MRKTELFFGAIVLGVGFLLLIGAVFDINVGGLICPSALILIGGWLIFRTQTAPEQTAVHYRFVGDFKRRRPWQLEQNEEHWAFVNDLKLDFSQAELLDGETSLRVGAFVNDLRIWVPPDLGVAINSMAFVTETRIYSERMQTILAPYTWQSDNYATATKKIILRPIGFFSEIRIKTSEESPSV
jgi:predicted membrane protein